MKIDRSKEFWISKAKIEGNSPVGAGMRAIDLKEYITGVFAAGVYYWVVGNELGASTCWDTAAYVLKCASNTTVMVS